MNFVERGINCSRGPRTLQVAVCFPALKKCLLQVYVAVSPRDRPVKLTLPLIGAEGLGHWAKFGGKKRVVITRMQLWE